MAAHRQFGFIDSSRAALTFAAALSLARVFAGGSWVFVIAFAAFVPPLLTWLVQYRRWNGLVNGALLAVVGVWLAVLIDDPSEVVAGIPTASALSSFRTDLAHAPHVLRSAVVPVHPVGAALLLAFIATYVAAIATDLIARHLDAAIGAIGPSVALYVAVAALGSGHWEPTTAAFAVVVIAYLVALHNSEVTARRTWFQTGRARRSQVVTGGVITGALLAVLAVALFPSVPGAKGDALINYRKLGVGRGAALISASDPLITMATKLNKDANKEIFTVDSGGVEAYWRLMALTDLDGSGHWSRNTSESVAHLSVPDLRSADTTKIHQTFQMVAEEDTKWLPAAYRPVAVSAPGIQVLPESQSILVNRGLTGLTYTVDSLISNPPVADLRGVGMDSLDAMKKYTKTSRNITPAVLATAHRITDPYSTPYDKAAALERYFQSDQFTYDANADYSGSNSPVADFLREKKGFCVQFAGAFAEMARAVGLPTRLAVGYQHGALSGGIFHVKGEDAHAWPEVYLGEQIGWYPFEPTKSRFDPTTGRGDPKAKEATGTTSPTTGTTPTTGQTTPSTSSATHGTVPFGGNNNKIQVNQPGTHTSHTGAHVLIGFGIVIGLAILATLAAVGALILSAWRRTRRRRYAPDPRMRVLGAWAEALERLTAAGVEPRPSATPIEFALRYAPAHGAGEAGPPLMDLARLHTAAMFAPDEPDPTDADKAWADVDQINASLRATFTRSARWSSRLRSSRRERVLEEV